MRWQNLALPCYRAEGVDELIEGLGEAPGGVFYIWAVNGGLNRRESKIIFLFKAHIIFIFLAELLA